MALPDGDVETLVHGWRLLAVLHSRIEGRMERMLQDRYRLSVNEYGVLELLSRQDEHHLRMGQLAMAMALSQAATTRLVNRLEDRGLLARALCADDRRGIYTNVTTEGLALLRRAKPDHDQILADALDEAGGNPDMAAIVAGIRAAESAPATSA